MFARLCRLVLLIALFQTAVAPLSRAEAPFSFDTTPGKLPKTIVPKNYSLRIEPNLTNFTTHGTLLIDVEVLKPTRKIVLNALDLEVTKALLGGSSSTLPLAKPEARDVTPSPGGEGRGEGELYLTKKDWVFLSPKLDTNTQTLALELPSKIPAGKHKLYLEFTGHLREQEQGLFYVKYNSPSGKKIMLASQMEATDARRMFPCWDEPVFRASVDLTVVLPAKFKAVSNMPIEKERALSGDLKETRFARTPPMASYLVVLVAGELEEIADQSEGIQIRVITTEGKKEQGRYALDATKKLLAYYNQYFGIKYPLPKLDQIAIPGGFDGAMENWGGITYNESMLLFDPGTSSQQTKRDIFITVAHEMAHQWFGDLVTMGWWNNLWLNEGLATWMETKATDHFNPDWQVLLSANADRSQVMSGDARSTTHAIQQAVNSESDASDAFDEITYQKGGAFLRMFEDYLGPENFRRGIHRYLSAHRYSSATTADLWDALQKTSGKPISQIASGWTEQPGLPVVKVKSTCANNTQTISLEQERFTVQNPHAKPLFWQIPVSLLKMSPRPSTSRLLLARKPGSAEFPDCFTPVKVNADDVGYYRVEYEPAAFQSIVARIGELSPADRLNLLNDSWAMVEASRASITNYLSLADSLRTDHTYALWDQMLTTFYVLDRLEIGRPDRDALRAYMRLLLRQQFERLGWNAKPGDSVNDTLLRAKIIGALGYFGDNAVITEAKARFQSFHAHHDSLPPDLRPPVFAIVGRYADKKTWEEIHSLARDAKGSEERVLFYQSLAAALDLDLARLTLAISLTDETIPHEAADLVSEVAHGSERPEVALDFAKEHLDALLSKVDAFARNEYLPSIYSAFSDEDRATELEKLVKSKIPEDAITKAAETAEKIRFRADLKRRVLPALHEWLRLHLPP